MSVVQPRDGAQLREALALLIARPELTAAEVERQIDSLLRYAEKQGLSLDHCLLAQGDGRSIASCLCVDSPGRTSSVFIPSTLSDHGAFDAVVALLKEVSCRARQRDVQFLQGLTRPEVKEEKAAFEQAGYDYLAQLIYLERDSTCSVLPDTPPPAVSWETYRPHTHKLFMRVVEGTYEGSLDCGSLNGLRDIEDILASHRATGEFDPQNWLVGLVDKAPVGAILLARVPERASYEVVYMGVLPDCRRKGYGAALLRRGVQIGRERAVLRLSLAVDARNTPAQRLYQRFGFEEVSRRDVWVNVFPRSGTSEHGPAAGS